MGSSNKGFRLEKIDSLISVEQQFIFLGLFVVFVLVIGFLLFFRRREKGRVLLTGLCDAGKTALFCRLSLDCSRETFTSMKENVGVYTGERNGRVVQIELHDLPGHEKLRYQMLDKIKTKISSVMFVIDSGTFQNDLKDVAEYLYLLLTDEFFKKNKPRLLITCHKQDLQFAKSSAAIRDLLETELDLLRTTKSAIIGDDSSRRSTYALGNPNTKNFTFSSLQPWRIDFCESNLDDLAEVKSWLSDVAASS